MSPYKVCECACASIRVCERIVNIIQCGRDKTCSYLVGQFLLLVCGGRWGRWMPRVGGCSNFEHLSHGGCFLPLGGECSNPGGLSKGKNLTPRERSAKAGVNAEGRDNAPARGEVDQSPQKK